MHILQIKIGYTTYTAFTIHEVINRALENNVNPFTFTLETSVYQATVRAEITENNLVNLLLSTLKKKDHNIMAMDYIIFQTALKLIQYAELFAPPSTPRQKALRTYFSSKNHDILLKNLDNMVEKIPGLSQALNQIVHKYNPANADAIFNCLSNTLQYPQIATLNQQLAENQYNPLFVDAQACLPIKPDKLLNVSNHIQDERKKAHISLILAQLKKNASFFIEYQQGGDCRDYLHKKGYEIIFLEFTHLILKQGKKLQEALFNLFVGKSENAIFLYLQDDENAEFLESLLLQLHKVGSAFALWEQHSQTIRDQENERYIKKLNLERERIFTEKLWVKNLDNTLQIYIKKIPKFSDKSTSIPAELIENEFLCKRLFNLYITAKPDIPGLFPDQSNLDEILFIINNPKDFLKDNSLEVPSFHLYEPSTKQEFDFSEMEWGEDDDDDDNEDEDEDDGYLFSQPETMPQRVEVVLPDVLDKNESDKEQIAIPPEQKEIRLEEIEQLLLGLKNIGKSNKNIVQKKVEAMILVDQLLPNITSNKSLLKIVELIEKKDSDFAYLREERDFWRFHKHANTKTWAKILGQIKTQMDINVTNCKQEKYSHQEYSSFLRVMNEHRGRGFGSVTHSKKYKQLNELDHAQDNITISAKF